MGMKEVYLVFHRGAALRAAVRDVFRPWFVKHIFLSCFLKFGRFRDLTHEEIIIPRAGNQSSKNLES